MWSVDSGWLCPGVDLLSFVERVQAHKDRLLQLADNLDADPLAIEVKLSQFLEESDVKILSVTSSITIRYFGRAGIKFTLFTKAWNNFLVKQSMISSSPVYRLTVFRAA